eukprot:TRINITY_DN15564_c0_g1_i1.p1 TRINITY_DN15564_c0_g1~~TRINITY_DN15564_c0_g1_i1.p1  ORF type:complete len:107 (-),score=6.76 TRINITY_DN15564_c0_g1_i1:645-965(-)
MHNYGKGNECLSTVLWLSKTELLLPETLRTISQNNPTRLMDQVDQVWRFLFLYQYSNSAKSYKHQTQINPLNKGRFKVSFSYRTSSERCSNGSFLISKYPAVNLTV